MDSVAEERRQRTREAKAQAQRRKEMAASMRGLLDALSGGPTPVDSPPATVPLDPEITDIAELLQKLKTIEKQQVPAGAPASVAKKKPRKKKRAPKPIETAEKRKPWGAATEATPRLASAATAKRPSSAKLRRPAAAMYERGVAGRRGSLPTRRPPPSPQLASPSPSAPSKLYSTRKSGSTIRLSASAASGGRLSRSGAAFDVSMSEHKRHNTARQACMLRASAQTISSSADGVRSPSVSSMHRISRGQSVVVTPLAGAKQTQRKQGKAITRERVVSIRNTLSEMCHEYPFGMVSTDNLETALAKLNLSRPELQTYRAVYRQCCTGRSMTTAKTTTANLRDYCTLLAVLVPGTARARLQGFASNFAGRLGDHKSRTRVEGNTATQACGDVDLYVDEVKAMMLCLLKVCEEETNGLSMPPATRDGPGAPASGPTAAVPVNMSQSDEDNLLGWTCRRPGKERGEATVVGMVNNDQATAADRARYREVATSSGSFVLLRRLMGILLPRLKQYVEEQASSRLDTSESGESSGAAAAGPAHLSVPIPFEVLWREVIECGLRPLVAAPGIIQPGSGYVTIALKQDLSEV